MVSRQTSKKISSQILSEMVGKLLWNFPNYLLLRTRNISMKVWKNSVTIRVNKMAATMEDFKKYKSKYQVAKSNCTKALKRLDAALAVFSKNNTPEMSPMRKMRFAATLMEVVDFNKSKIQHWDMCSNFDPDHRFLIIIKIFIGCLLRNGCILNF